MIQITNLTITNTGSTKAENRIRPGNKRRTSDNVRQEWPNVRPKYVPTGHNVRQKNNAFPDNFLLFGRDPFRYTFIVYKNQLYKNKKAQNDQKIEEQTKNNPRLKLYKNKETDLKTLNVEKYWSFCPIRLNKLRAFEARGP